MTESPHPDPDVPDRHVAVSERDVLALVAIVARVHSEMLVDALDEGFPKFLQRRLREVGLLETGPNGTAAATATNGELSLALDGIVTRLRAAIGEA